MKLLKFLLLFFVCALILTLNQPGKVFAAEDLIEIEFYAVGFADTDTSTYPAVEISFNGSPITTFSDIQGTLSPYNPDIRTFTTAEPIDLQTIKIEYLDDSDNSDRTILVDKIALNGREIDVTWPSVYSEGTYVGECTTGYTEKEFLTCQGFFEITIPTEFEIPKYFYPEVVDDASVDTSWSGNRTIINSEQGYYFMYPRGYPDNTEDLENAAALVTLPSNIPSFGSFMQTDALKISHSRMNSFHPDDESIYNLFPYTDFVAFNDAEILAGRDSLFITANDGDPVVRDWGAQAVDVGDDRFIDFWLNQNVNEVLLDPNSTLQNLWVGIDEAIFQRCLFSPCSNWDAEYPQNEGEYLTDIEYFFSQVQELQSSLNIMANIGSISDEFRFDDIFQYIEGVILEATPDPNLETYKNNQSEQRIITNKFRRILWLAENNKVVIQQSVIPEAGQEESLKFAYLFYLISRGDNFFFGPLSDVDSKLIEPNLYEEIKTDLGWHTGSSTEISRNVWKRDFEGGTAYINLNQTETINIDVSDSQYLTSDDQAVTDLELAPFTTEYLLFKEVQSNSSRSQSSRSNSRRSSAPICNDTVPAGQPDLFQINRTGKTAKLYFTPVNGNINNYHVIFGYEEGDQRFGSISEQVSKESNGGVQNISIHELDPNVEYWFKVISANGCATGTWSNWLKAGKVNSNQSIFYRYLYSAIL